MELRLNRITEQYLQGRLDRRGFFQKMTAALGSYALVHQYLEATGLAAGPIARLESQRASVVSRETEYPSGEHSITASLSFPEEASNAAGVIVIHENRGLNEHTRDVARRLAGAGYAALAPDLLSRVGGTAAAGSPDNARTMIRQIEPDAAVADLIAARKFLQGLTAPKIDKVGSVGFCWGGARSFRLATADPELSAAIVFYGSPPPDELLAGIACPVLGLYGEDDARITSTVEATAAQMAERGKSFQHHVYPGARHAFFNDTGTRYDPDAAADAWERTLKFFGEHLGE